MKQVSHCGRDRFSRHGAQDPGECALGGHEVVDVALSGCDEIRGGEMRIKNG